jgi:ABC-type nitrate/sulfonate/bicarbonate transport system permease component
MARVRNATALQVLTSQSLWGMAGFAVFLCCWWLLSLSIGAQRLPSPADVATQLYVLFSESAILMSRGGPATIAPHMLDSLVKYLAGAGIGIVLGVFLGLLMKLSPTAYDLLILPVEGIRTVPALAFSPFLLLWYGPTALSAILLIVIYVSLMLVISTINAIENVSPIYMQFARTLGATERQIFRTVILPAILPELIGALRVALARSWGLLVVAELMGSARGLGEAMTIVMPYFAIGLLIGIIIVITLMANATDILFLLATRRVYRWAPRSGGS